MRIREFADRDGPALGFWTAAGYRRENAVEFGKTL